MKKQKSYSISCNRFLSVLSILCACLSLAAYIILNEAFSPKNFSFVALFPVAALIIFILVVLLSGKEHLYRTSVSVMLFCLFEFISAFAFPSTFHRILGWVLPVLFAVVYHLTISGFVVADSDRTILLLFELVAVAIKILPVFSSDGVPFRIEMLYPNAYSVFALLSLIFLTVGMKMNTQGYHPSWGDRCDGRLVRTLDPMTYVAVYIMPNRNGSDNYFRETIDVTEVDKYIHNRRRSDLPHLSMTQIFLAAYCRTIAKYPAINRFISGQRIFSRGNEIVFNMMIKREMTIEGEETAIKLHLQPDETIYSVSEKLDRCISDAKKETESSFDATAKFLTAIPGLLMRFCIGFLRFLDYFGLLPKALIEVSPFHGSVFFTSMASLGIPAVFHHLYDFGNLPVFICLGAKYKNTVLNEDGIPVERKFIDFTVVSDERICDGFYYSRAFKTFKHYILHPNLLEQPPEEVIPDQD